MSDSLSPEDRDRLVELFERAAELPAADRAAFVARECGANAALQQELVRLLAAVDNTNLIDKLQPGFVQAPTTLQPGQQVDTYRVLELVGEGGMGQVYAAEQLAPIRRKVALKVIKLGMDSHQVAVRFEAERQALARMSHPHIAQVYDGGITEDGRSFFVMEFVSGLPITDYCDQNHLSTRARLELFLQICDGVQHAHLKGIIHRDLKPSNLLVMSQDAGTSAKIIDFGVARATTGRLADQTLQTMVGQIVGTLDYMSPEQADPSAIDIDTRSDIYSLGVVLYQLLSGLLPFDLSSAADVPLSELQRRIREQDPQTPSTRLRSRIGTATGVAPRHGTDERTLIRQLAGDLDWICLKALEKDPARRYQSAAELAADVLRHLNNEPVTAARPDAFYRLRKFAQRNRTAVVAGAMVTTFAIAGAYGVVHGRLEAMAKEEVLGVYTDNVLLGGIEAMADELWPPHPDKIDELQALMDLVERRVGDLSQHKRHLASLQPKTAAPKQPDRFGRLEQGFEERSLAQALGELIHRLERFDQRLAAGDALGRPDYWGLEKRLAEARRLATGFAPGGEYDRAWQDQLPAIRAAYPGIPSLDVQMGLIPIGPDPDSDFWLFAHLLSGEPATIVDGRVVLSAGTGLVMTLLPGGTYRMGSEFTEEPGPNHVHPRFRRDREGPIHEVTVAPYFLSKFEMTQAQWERLVGSNPSFHGSTPVGHVALAPTEPVNQVTWNDCDAATARLGLTLPAEEQWEYAARGGTTTTWWVGDEPSLLAGVENLRGKADGHGAAAPVGSMAANGFGLYDMLGNVSEWCRNHPVDYGAEQSAANAFPVYVGRGGNFLSPPKMARSGMRMSQREKFNVETLGLRPARPLVVPGGR